MKWLRRAKREQQSSSLEFDMHVRMGDAANAARQWDVAAEHYRNAVKERPGDCAMHIQLGHSLKEQNFWKEAEGAYRNAIAADDANADAYLHLGHISKLQKHMKNAIEAYIKAARLGSTSNVGRDARQELSALGLTPPPIISIAIPASLDSKAYKALTDALKDGRWNKASLLIKQLPAERPAEIKLIEAQLMHLRGRFSDAIGLYEKEDLWALGNASGAALRALYSDIGAGEKGESFAAFEIRRGLSSPVSFDALADPIAHLAGLGKLETAFKACESLFSNDRGQVSSSARSAADVKRDRGSSHFTKTLSQSFRSDFLDRAQDLEAREQHAQALLLREEASALSGPDAGTR